MQNLSVDFSAWEDNARWWEDEGLRARERMHVDDETLAQSQQAFGKIGASSVGAAYAGALEARRALGERLGACAESVAAHIRRDLQTYAAGEEEARRSLST